MLGCNGNPNEWTIAYHRIGAKGGSKVEDAADAILKEGFFGPNQDYISFHNDNEILMKKNKKMMII